MKKYDPSTAPDAKHWLALDEGERIALAREFHARSKIRLPNAEADAVIHAIVENQLAERLPETIAALDRLQAEGLDRHDSVHAIGSVLLECMRTLMNGSRTQLIRTVPISPRWRSSLLNPGDAPDNTSLQQSNAA